jgi:hypothetical protein
MAFEIKKTGANIGVFEFIYSKPAENIDRVKLTGSLKERLSGAAALEAELTILTMPAGGAADFFNTTDRDLALIGKQSGMQKIIVPYLYFIDGKLIISVKIIDCGSLCKEANYFASCAGAAETEGKLKIIAEKILLNLKLRSAKTGTEIKSKFPPAHLKAVQKIPYDSSRWNIIKLGAGCKLEHNRQKINISFTPEARDDEKYNVFGIFFVSKYKIEGDFDAVLDYSLTEWPCQNGTRIGIGIFAEDDFLGKNKWYQQAERISSTWADSGFVPFAGDAYLVDTADDNIKGVMEASGGSGQIRITRTGNIFRAYCPGGDKNSEWLNIYSSTSKSGAVNLFTGAWNHNYCFTKKDIKVCFAAVEITAENIKIDNKQPGKFIKKLKK